MRRPLAALTLVELLMVVFIIAVLVSLLTSSLHKARIRAVSSSCESNLRQLCVAAELYDQDWAVLPIGWKDDVPWETRWHHAMQPYLGKGIGFAGGVFVCPAEPDQPLGYAMNWLVNCEKRWGWDWSVRHVQEPARTVLFADGDGFNSCLYPDGIYHSNCIYRHGGRYTRASYGKAAEAIRKGWANAVFFDGHVESIRALPLESMLLRRSQ